MTNKNISLFVDAHSFDKELQGTQTFIKELYTALLADYPQLDIYFGAYHTDKIHEAFPLVDSSHVLQYKRKGIRRFVSDIPSFIKKYQFHFAHFQYISPKQSPHCKYIVTLHDTLYNDFFSDLSFVYTRSRDLLFGRSIKKAHIKTTVSDHSQKSISEYYKIPAEQIHIIPNAVNRSFNNHVSGESAANKIKEKYGIGNFILLVSRIEPRKNHALLLDTFLQLKLYRKKIALVFIGKNSIKVPDLQSAIDALDDEQRKYFYWFEQVSQDDLVSFYTAARLFVYPSKGEGFGIPPLEAAFCKCPVLCSSASAMKNFSFFRPYTFDPYNQKDFEEKLQQMLVQPPGENFLNSVAEEINKTYSWKQSADIFYNLLQPNTACL